MRRTVVQLLFTLALAGLLLGGAVAHAGTIYYEDFSDFDIGPLEGQKGWTSRKAPGLQVGPNGKKLRGVGTDAISENTSLFSLAPSTTEVVLEATMRHRKGYPIQVVNLSGLFEIGQAVSGYWLRSEGVIFFNGDIPGDDTLSSRTHRYVDHRFTYNFVSDVGSWEVSVHPNDGGDGLYTEIATFSSSDLGKDDAVFRNRANWTGLRVRSTGFYDVIDDIRVSTTIADSPAAVPLPSALSLGVVGLVLVLAGRRRRGVRRSGRAGAGGSHPKT